MRFGTFLLAAACASLAQSARAPRSLRVCTTPEPGFNEFTPAALAKYVAAGKVDKTLMAPTSSTIDERGLVVQESEMSGYMHAQRTLMFTGKNAIGQSFPKEDGNLWLGDSYTLHVYPSYSHLLYYTRTGFCQIGWGPVTVKPSRETCSASNCENITPAKNTVSLAPAVAAATPVVALDNVTADMTCCVDFPQTTVGTGMAVAFRKFVLTPWYMKTTVHNIALRMLLFIVLAAHIIWFFERLSNNSFPRRYLAGIDDAIWFSAVTVTTVGYGDKVPRTGGGRAATLIWMLGGIVLSSLFTAVITSEVTSDRLANDVTAISDFSGRTICSTRGYWNSDPLIEKNRKFFGKEVQGDSLAYCIDQLIKGSVDGVYYDRPPMEKMLLDRHVEMKFPITPDLQALQLTPVFPDAFNPRFGAPAVPALRNEYNEQVLELSVRGHLERMYEHHFSGVGFGSGGVSEVTFDRASFVALCAFVAVYLLLILNGKRVNRHRVSHEKQERKRRGIVDGRLTAPSKFAWFTRYFDFSDFFEWRENREEDHDKTVDTKLDSIEKTLATLAVTQATLAAAVTALASAGGAQPPPSNSLKPLTCTGVQL